MPSPQVQQSSRGPGPRPPGYFPGMRNLCVVACLSSCLLVSVANLALHVLRRDSRAEDPPSPFDATDSSSSSSSALSAGVLSDPSDQLFSLESQMGILPQEPQEAPPGHSANASSPLAHLGYTAGFTHPGGPLASLNQLPRSSRQGEGGAEAGGPTQQTLGQRHREQSKQRQGQNQQQQQQRTPLEEEERQKQLRTRADTAICLLGGARDFEATGPSILKHLVAAYQPADVFVHAPLDRDSAKLWVLARAPRVAAVRVFASTDLDEATYPKGMLQASGSPNGVQGLLQYFRLVEGCLYMITQHEKRTGGGEYRWVVRARLDSYWSGRPRPLAQLNPAKYTIPHGNDFKGYNDRFGVGNRATTAVAMRRLSLLSLIKKAKKYRSLNSEGAYMLQFKLSRVHISRHHFPFCILGRRLPRKIVSQCDPAVPSLASTLPLDGTKCLPCAPCRNHNNKTVMEALYLYMDIPRVRGRYPGSKGLRVCNLTGAWEEGAWQRRFDAAAGRALANDRELVLATAKDPAQCTQALSGLHSKALHWDGPPPAAVCVRSALGPSTVLGEESEAFATLTEPLSASSVVVTLGASKWSRERTWELALQREVGAKVLSWDAKDVAILGRAMEALGRTRLDAIKFSAFGTDLSLLDLLLSRVGKGLPHTGALPVCQLLVAFPKKFQGILTSLQLRTIRRNKLVKPVQYYGGLLLSRGMHLDSCIGGQGGSVQRCTFFSLTQCDLR